MCKSDKIGGQDNNLLSVTRARTLLAVDVTPNIIDDAVADCVAVINPSGETQYKIVDTKITVTPLNVIVTIFYHTVEN